MSLKEILITEEISKVFVSSIPKGSGHRFFVYFNKLYPELEQGETVEFEGDVENIIANASKVFVEKSNYTINHVQYFINHTLEELIKQAISDEHKLIEQYG